MAHSPMKKVEHPCLPKWRAIIAEAKKRGYFTESEKARARNWDTCLIGEAVQRGYIRYTDREDDGGIIFHMGTNALQRSKPPTIASWGEFQALMRKLGGFFAIWVRDNRFTEARCYLREVEYQLGRIV
jgi:hypothetical protein